MGSCGSSLGGTAQSPTVATAPKLSKGNGFKRRWAKQSKVTTTTTNCGGSSRSRSRTADRSSAQHLPRSPLTTSTSSTCFSAPRPAKSSSIFINEAAPAPAPALAPSGAKTSNTEVYLSENAGTEPAQAPAPVLPPTQGFWGRDSGLLPPQFPVDLLRSTVFTFLSAGCLARAGIACPIWNEAAADEHLWKALCLKQWVGKHVALLEDSHHHHHRHLEQQQQQQQQQEEGRGEEEAVDLPPSSAPASSSSSSPSLPSTSSDDDDDDGHDDGDSPPRRHLASGDTVGGWSAQNPGEQGRHRRRRRRRAVERARHLRGGLEDLVAAMPIKVMRKRLEELGANPGRLANCLEKDECVLLMTGSMLISREGLLREKGKLPQWVARVRGWRWSYYFANKDSKRRWMSVDDITRTPWTMRFPGHVLHLAPPPPLPATVPCEFHRNFSYTDDGLHQDGLDWHFEDSGRCVKVSHYPALEAERTECWGWRLANTAVIFDQERAKP